MCRERVPKSGLVRFVKTSEDKVIFDYHGKIFGRSAYVCMDTRHWCEALGRNNLSRSLKLHITGEDKERLKEELDYYFSTVSRDEKVV